MQDGIVGWFRGFPKRMAEAHRENNIFFAILAALFGSKNEREIKALRPLVAAINELEPRMMELTDEELSNQTVIFREQLAQGATLDDLLIPAFATVREAGRRVLNMRHFDVQLIGGIVLHRGKIAEMKTGEGKTLVATLPVYLNALAGKGVHVVTVNDYLAKRDSEWMGRIYKALGMTVGVIVHDLRRSGTLRQLRLRHHLRHQQRIRLRLPARQHEVPPERIACSANTSSASSMKSIRS